MIVFRILKRGQVVISRMGIYVIFKCATETERAVGFKITHASQMLFSERTHPERYPHKLRLGPIYMRTFKAVDEKLTL